MSSMLSILKSKDFFILHTFILNNPENTNKKLEKFCEFIAEVAATFKTIENFNNGIF